MLLNNQWITEEIKEENVKYQEKSENENITIKINLRTAKSVQEEMYSNTNLPQETNKKYPRMEEERGKQRGKRSKDSVFMTAFPLQLHFAQSPGKKCLFLISDLLRL